MTIKNINIDLVKEIISFSKINHSLIIHASTIGLLKYERKSINEDVLLGDKSYPNYYLETKKKAEDLLINAKLEDNSLNIYILRIGNLMPRLRDYKFQKNPEKNAIYHLVKTKVTNQTSINLNHELDISPVDLIAKGITNLINHLQSQVIYHLYVPFIISFDESNKIMFNTKYKFINQDKTINILNIKSIDHTYINKVLEIWTK